jgi:hypothetical protein
LGSSEGRNLIFDMRLGRVDQLQELARDLATGSDVIVAMGWYPVIAAREATRTLPIVTVTDDPTRLGFAQRCRAAAVGRFHGALGTAGCPGTRMPAGSPARAGQILSGVTRL